MCSSDLESNRKISITRQKSHIPSGGVFEIESGRGVHRIIGSRVLCQYGKVVPMQMDRMGDSHGMDDSRELWVIRVQSTYS